MRILVTGSRRWDYLEFCREFKAALAQHAGDGPHVIVEGGASGADNHAGRYAGRRGWKVYEYLADWHTHGKAAGPIRNQQMVDTGADLCLAFPIGESRGTYDCVRRAEAAGIPVVVWPEPEE